MKIKKMWIPAVALCLSGCEAASNAAKILCGDGHAKGLMTVGLNFDFFENLGLMKTDGTVEDSELQSLMNDTLNSVGVDSSVLEVNSVESLSDNDEFRFLEFGGAFGSGFGVATKLVTDAFSGANLVDDSSPFSFINESFSVNAAPATVVTIAEAYEDQWALEQTRYDDAVSLIEQIRSAQGSDKRTDPVVVAVLDTGVDSNHPDLKDIMVDGADFSDSGTGTDDENGHGTHCAGVIAGQAAQANGTLGVAESAEVRIMPIKVLGKEGGGGFQAIEKGVRYATEQGVDVISMSLGAGLEFSDMKDQSDNPLDNGVFDAAIEAGIIVVVAAGNESCALGGECEHSTSIFPKTFDEYTVVPCAYEGVICVGATNANETLASYSNFSSDKTSDQYRTKADINAPGTAIYSTWPQSLGKDYNTISGTSMATPFVAGIAALFKWADADITQTEFLNYLTRGESQPSDIIEKSGVGRADLYASSVALANDENLSGVDEEFHPDPNEVEAPDTGSGSDGDSLVSDLWSAVCQ